MQQSNAAAATTLYDHAAGGSLHNAGPASDAGDAVMARWLQSAGLQHLASPVASTSVDHRLLPNLLMQVTKSLLLKLILVVLMMCILIHLPVSEHEVLFFFEVWYDFFFGVTQSITGRFRLCQFDHSVSIET